MWTDGNGAFCFGDCPAGWRAATDGEVAAWRQAQLVAPDQVPMWAMQAALKLAGKYDAINTAVTGWASATDSNEVAAFFAWTMGNYASRQSAFIATFAAAFGLAPADIDALCAAAGRIAGSAG